MEGLIIFIVITVISMIVKGKDAANQPKNKQMPPFGSQPQKEATLKPKRRTLEDFANEIFSELNEKQPQEAKVKPQSSVTNRGSQTTIAEKAETIQRKEVEQRIRSERPLVQQLKQDNKQVFQVVPKSRKALMQAVIMSEVLGPPKARKR